MSSDLARIQQNPREVGRWQKAQQDYLGGRYSSALAGYRHLVKRFPGAAELWCELGMAAAGDLDFEQADKAFRRTRELVSKNAPLLMVLGQQYHRLRKLDQARVCFEQAAAADPSSIEARLTLASWLERERRLDEALQCAESCLADHPGNSHASYVRALLLHQKQGDAEAETILRDLLKKGVSDPNIAYSSRHLLGVVLDALGRYAEAMQCLVEAKTQLRGVPVVRRLESEYDRAAQRRRQLLGALSPETIRNWRNQAPAAGSPGQLAFLGGHPRSGTTLIEQILGSHPDVLAFDEPEAFVQEVWNQLAPLQSPTALTLEGLDSLSDGRRSEMVRRYFKSLFRGRKEPAGAKVLLDKNPSPTMALHLWLRVFADLKVIIALRDPRDVVISSFFQNLALNPTSVNFLSLEGTAKHYSDLMDTWLRLRELGGFDWIETHYRDVVRDVETEGRRVTEFLALSWLPQQAAPHQTAGRQVLFAPTFSDVARPLYQSSLDRWQHYSEALAGIQDRLVPYCRAFGYSNGS